jgi:hypothetical protein
VLAAFGRGLDPSHNTCSVLRLDGIARVRRAWKLDVLHVLPHTPLDGHAESLHRIMIAHPFREIEPRYG